MEKDQTKQQTQTEYQESDSTFSMIGQMITKEVKHAKEFLLDSKYKFQHLEETNMDVGLTHLYNGNWHDARFRFWFMSKVWPENLEARYLLALSQFACLKLYLMRPVLVKILQEDPQFSKAKTLLQKLDERDYNAIREILLEYILSHTLPAEELEKLHLYQSNEDPVAKVNNVGPQQP